ncbi:hypothetical protein SEVIR_7G089100v4 [Setaria viridis]|uniref:Uncharacterized protein n=1 Tax=Setaria viridis TaxID=4556 RepID=A0A4U6TTP7_SETVI|nr:hypothetical protein SEVIR_7G089100v2 [Setaria viridis]TKW04126.1 hypothetical protein SEVIR_7G089100v2 [Setaria viridis]TKW04127.1 hypothetical protein SEVIR_7G089100v2 [Setaria viridis]TKW04128.1 hypothetical protein SEVIR_7G089100v2 [Setaria viridis]TKW04129.1 hypothetical protein SEVIR_7G089100v2 [Setaria viridis]
MKSSRRRPSSTSPRASGTPTLPPPRADDAPPPPPPRAGGAPQVDGAPTPPPSQAGGTRPPPSRAVAWPCGVRCPPRPRHRLAVQGPKPVVGAPGRRQRPQTATPLPPLTPSSSVQIEAPRQGFKHAPLAETWHWRASFWSVAHLEGSY